MKIETLLREKSYSELTELEQLFVLENMGLEAYESAHQIVILAEKLKQNQVDLAPNLAIKTKLIAKMHAKNAKNWHFPMPYRMAASLLFCLGIFYFLIKNKSNNAINSKQINALIETQNSIKLTQIEPIKNELKLFKSIKNKRIKTPILINENDAEEAALLMSFNRKNPNLEWQEEDEEVLNSAQSTLRCEANK